MNYPDYLDEPWEQELYNNYELRHPSRLQAGDCILVTLPDQTMPTGMKVNSVSKNGAVWTVAGVSMNKTYEFEFDGSSVITVDRS